MKPLTRDEFRELCLLRDKHTCVCCHATQELSVHHILERKLWGESGGYFLDNAASLCPTHHLQAEYTTLSVEEVRQAAHITNVIVPEGLEPKQVYDKWGNQINPDGTRVQGPLFQDDGCQKALKRGGVFHLYQPSYA